MARNRRNSIPPPPGDGGYEFEVVELGEPTFFGARPPVKYRGGLVPVGDGEGLPVRPAPTGKTARPEIDDSLNFEANLQLGLTRLAQKDHASATALLEQSVAIARRANDPRMLASALRSLGTVLRESGRSEAAVPLIEEAVALSESTGDRRLIVRSLIDQGTLLRQLGRFEAAATVLERALATVGEF